ncbi:hypothetical protein V1511DRAFT_492085 [Dipodascopsis uninucleata]
MSSLTRQQRSRIHIAGLDMAVTNETLLDAFIPFGDIVNIDLPKDLKSNNSHRGYATIEYESPEDAEAAIDNMDQSQLYGKTLRVTISKTQMETFNIHNSKAAVWEQEGWLQKNVVNESENIVSEVAPDAMESLEE